MNGLEQFVQRVLRRAKDTPADKALYLRIMTGERRKDATTLASSIPVAGRDPGELAQSLREQLAAVEGDDSKAWIQALHHGETSPVDTVAISLEAEPVGRAAPLAPLENGGGRPDQLSTAVGVLVQTVERMARNADARADLAEHRALEATRDLRDYALAAQQAEHDAELALFVAANEKDKVEKALEHVSPMMKMAMAKWLGLAPGQAPPKQLEAKPDGKEPAKGTPEAPAAPADPAEVRAIVRKKALAAVGFLRNVAKEYPDLLGDEELVEGMKPLVMAAMGLGDGASA